jgi:hypothetical protein
MCCLDPECQASIVYVDCIAPWEAQRDLGSIEDSIEGRHIRQHCMLTGIEGGGGLSLSAFQDLIMEVVNYIADNMEIAGERVIGMK